MRGSALFSHLPLTMNLQKMLIKFYLITNYCLIISYSLQSVQYSEKNQLGGLLMLWYTLRLTTVHETFINYIRQMNLWMGLSETSRIMEQELRSSCQRIFVLGRFVYQACFILESSSFSSWCHMLWSHMPWCHVMMSYVMKLYLVTS